LRREGFLIIVAEHLDDQQLVEARDQCEAFKAEVSKNVLSALTRTVQAEFTVIMSTAPGRIQALRVVRSELDRRKRHYAFAASEK
jgi:hypothetical protein